MFYGEMQRNCHVDGKSALHVFLRDVDFDQFSHIPIEVDGKVKSSFELACLDIYTFSVVWFPQQRVGSNKGVGFI
jgi:hypothetical protein